MNDVTPYDPFTTTGLIVYPESATNHFDRHRINLAERLGRSCDHHHGPIMLDDETASKIIDLMEAELDKLTTKDITNE